MNSKYSLYRLTIALTILAAAMLIAGCSAPSGNNTSVRPLSSPVPSPSASPVTCDEAQLEALVGAALAKALMGTNERPHTNYSVRGCVVALQGWVSTNELHSAVIDEVSAIEEVTRIKTSKFFVGEGNYPHRPSSPCACATGYIPCGDICIPDTEKCNTPGCPGAVATPPTSNSANKP